MLPSKFFQLIKTTIKFHWVSNSFLKIHGQRFLKHTKKMIALKVKLLILLTLVSLYKLCQALMDLFTFQIFLGLNILLIQAICTKQDKKLKLLFYQSTKNTKK